MKIPAQTYLTSSPLPRFGNNATGTYEDVYQRSESADHGSTRAYDHPEENKRAGRRPDRPVFKNIFKFLSPGQIVLELGCNSGNNGLVLAPKYKFFGVDLAARQLANFKAKAAERNIRDRVQLRKWDFAENGDLPPEWDLKGKVQAIYAVQVLSHLNDDCYIRTMQRLKDYLAPGGIFITTNIDSRLSNADYPPSFRLGGAPHSPEVVKQAFEGLELVENIPFGPGSDGSAQWFENSKEVSTHMSWYIFRKPL